MDAINWSVKLQWIDGSDTTLSQISRYRKIKNPTRWDQIFRLSLVHVNKLKIHQFYMIKLNNYYKTWQLRMKFFSVLVSSWLRFQKQINSNI